jgi:putative ABC transport system permease protein
VKEKIKTSLLASHSGQEDFTILNKEDYLAAANQTMSQLTAFIVAIASTSLIVGGIGIMNIMLVGVSERTKEIGVRKAVGATNQQILSQFSSRGHSNKRSRRHHRRSWIINNNLLS